MNKELQRRGRGWVEEADLSRYRGLSRSDLIALLASADACERTIAARLLPLDCDVTHILLEALIHEPALYTRLAITAKLESGGEATARQMIPLLNNIGHNQHRTPIAPSKKKSYPLPRDLIARSLGRMSPDIFPLLLDSAEQLSPFPLRELIDALGFMAFYHPSVATEAHYQRLLSIKHTHRKDALIPWKMLICFSAFPQSKAVLLQETVFLAEAQRSLCLLDAKKD